MSPFDLIIIAALVWFVYTGAKIGLAKELVGLTGWLIAALVALTLGGRAGAMATGFLPSLKALPVELTGFLIALFGTHIFFRVIGYLFNNMLGGNGQSTFDRMGGAFIGFVKGAFIISVVALALNSLNLGSRLEGYQSSSSLFPHMSKFAQMVVNQVIRATPSAGVREATRPAEDYPEE